MCDSYKCNDKSNNIFIMIGVYCFKQATEGRHRHEKRGVLELTARCRACYQYQEDNSTVDLRPLTVISPGSSYDMHTKRTPLESPTQ